MDKHGQRYQYDRNYHRSGRSSAGGHVRVRRYTTKDFLMPILMLITGAAVLGGTILCASLGVFGQRDSRDSVLGSAQGFAASSIRMVEPSEATELLRESKIRGLLASMTVEEKVGQLLLLRSHDIPEDEFFSELADTHAGGVVLFGNDVKGKTAEELTAFVSRIQQAGDRNMFICVDEEGGTVVRVSSNRKLRDSSFRSPRRLYADGGMDYISYDATEKARFLRQFGINVNFAPVADVVTDPDAMMYERALGLDAAATAKYVTTVVTASEAEGVGTCLKHFPGYGNTSGDTHNGLVTLDTTLEQLRACDLIPFAAGIDAGSNAVMITHTVMTAIDPDRPASMSPAVIGLLRGEMGFDGVIVSDGMDMGAILDHSGGRDVCVTAFLAGIDLMCTPADGREAFNALIAAVQDGTISAQRLDEAVERILRWKITLGLYPDERPEE